MASALSWRRCLVGVVVFVCQVPVVRVVVFVCQVPVVRVVVFVCQVPVGGVVVFVCQLPELWSLCVSCLWLELLD